MVVSGSIAAAATTGALVSIGHRLGGAALPFAAIGASLSRSVVSVASPGLVLTGVAVHLVMVFAWTAVFVWLMHSRGWRPMPAAFGVAASAHVVDWIAAWATGRGLASELALGDRVVLAVVLAMALVAGIRLAFPASRSA